MSWYQGPAGKYGPLPANPPVGVAEGVGVAEAEGDGLGVGVGVAVAEGDGLGVGVAVGETEGEGLGVGETEGEGLGLGRRRCLRRCEFSWRRALIRTCASLLLVVAAWARSGNSTTHASARPAID